MNEHAKIVTVIGRRGYGKSKFLKETLLPEITGPVVVLDTKGEYGDSQGFTEIYTDLESFLDADGFERASLRLSPSDANAAMLALFHYSPHTVVVEEAWQWCAPNRLEDGLEQLVRLGRHPNITLILVSHRARDFPQVIYHMTDTLYLFQQKSPHDRTALEDAIGEDVPDANTMPRDAFHRFDL